MSNRRNRSTHVVRQLLTMGSILHGQVGTDNLTESRQSPGNPLIEIPRGLASTDRPGMGHELEDVPFSSGSHPCDRGIHRKRVCTVVYRLTVYVTDPLFRSGERWVPPRP